MRFFRKIKNKTIFESQNSGSTWITEQTIAIFQREKMMKV